MQLVEILSTYPDDALDRLAADKVDEVANLRLPRAVLIQEIAAALSSLSYVAQALAPARPPTFALLKGILDAPERRVPAAGFRERVLAHTEELTRQATEGAGLSQGKSYNLYLRILRSAWEDDGQIDRSETRLLEALRGELGIWMREHLLLEHHADVRALWDGPNAFERARNHLLSTGVLLTVDSSYLVADEVGRKVRRCWGIELEDASYRRLLARFTGSQLRDVLERADLPLSGSKEERLERVAQSAVPPSEAIDALHINDVREICRACGVAVSQAKSDLVESLVEHFDNGRDLVPDDGAEPPEVVEQPDAARVLDDTRYARLLRLLTIDQLYDMLADKRLARTGSKTARIERVLASGWSERRMLEAARRVDLMDLCRKLGVPVSGVKDEILERLIQWAAEAPLEDVVAAPPGASPVDSAMEAPATAHQAAPEEPARGTSGPDGSAAPGGRRGQIPADGGGLTTTNAAAAAAACGWATNRQEEDAEATVQAPARPQIPRAAQVMPEAPVRAPVPLSRPQPARLREIQVDFPDLELDEQVVLSMLREARSLTELEIERVAVAQDLGWFLTKAHMAELMARLRRQGRPVVRLRSGAGLNIYEWAGEGGAAELDRRTARDVTDALRQGVVPEQHLDGLVVGQDAARRHLLELLEHVQGGKSEVRFLRGPYGAGKSFICAWLREQAVAAEMAVSTVRIGPDQPLSDLALFFGGVAAGLRTAAKRDASALPDLLEAWLLSIHQKVARTEGVRPFEPTHRAHLAPLVQRQIDEQLAQLSSLDPGFAPAVAGFYRARLDGDLERANAVVAWLRGSRAISASHLRDLGVRGHLGAEEVFPRMRALLSVIAGGSLRGLVLLVDELELIRRFAHARQREQAYETLRLLIDEAGENGLPGCLLLFTGTDALFEDARYGLKSYEALANRVAPPKEAQPVSVRQPVIQLDRFDRHALLEMARRVREIHGIAYDWAATARVPDDALDRIVEEWVLFGGGEADRLPRPILRELVNILDICEENPDVRAEECIRRPVEVSETAAAIVSLLAD